MDIGVEVIRSNFSTLSVLNPVSRPSQVVPGATASIQWTPPQQVTFNNDYYAVIDTETPFDEGKAVTRPLPTNRHDCGRTGI